MIHLNMTKMNFPIMLWNREMKLKLKLKQEDIAEISDPILADLNILSYNTVDAALASSEKFSDSKERIFLEKSVLPDAIFRRNQLKGYKASITKKFKKGEITEEQKFQG